MSIWTIILAIISIPCDVLRSAYLLFCWGYRVIRYLLYRQWKTSSCCYFHIHNPEVSLLPKPLPAHEYEWTCGFYIENLLPREFIIDRFHIEINDPQEIMGLSGDISELFTIASTPLSVSPYASNLGRTKIPSSRFPVNISKSALDWLSTHRGQIPIRMTFGGFCQNKTVLHDVINCIAKV